MTKRFSLWRVGIVLVVGLSVGAAAAEKASALGSTSEEPAAADTASTPSVSAKTP